MPPTSPNLAALAVSAIVLTSTAMLAGPSQAQVADTNGSCALVAELVATDLSSPWGLAFPNASTALVSERPGTMQLINLADGSKQMVAGVPQVVDNRQGGLLDVVLAPDFDQSGLVFFSYAEPRTGGTGTSIGRAVLAGWEDGAPELTDVRVIFQQSGPDGNGRHFGSRIVFLPDGTLTFTIGDRGTPERAQDPRDHAGSVLRINQDGTVPQDNPFAGPNETQPEIWSLGHRNPQGAALDPSTGELWTVEHGARGGDEINNPKAGLNYGWPTISYGVNYSGSPIGVGTEAEGLEQPVYYWDPAIAPSGMAILNNSALFPSWDGDIFVGALRGQMMVRLDRLGGSVVGEERYFEEELGRVRDVRQGPDGALWLLTDDTRGSLIRVRPRSGTC